MTQAELALRLEADETRARLALLADAAPAALVQFDAEGRYVFANKAYLSRWGVALEKVVGRTMREIVGEDAFSRVAEPFSKALEGCAVDFEEELPSAAGSRILQVSFTPQLAADGRVTGVIGVGVDVTARRRAEAALHEHDRHFRVALEAAEMGFFEWDVVADRCSWSLPNAPAFGAQAHGQDSRFEQLLPFVHEEDVERLKQTVSRALVYGGVFEAEFRVRVPQRGLFWLAARGHVFFCSAGRASRMIGVVRDATARRQAEEERERLLEALEAEHQALRASEARHRALFESNPQTMLVYDPVTLKIIAANQAAVEHYGWARDEFLALTVADLKPVEDHAQLPRAGDQEARRRHLGRHRKKDGSIIDVEIASHAVRFEGKTARLVLVNDVTDRNLAQRRAAAEARDRLMIFDAVPAMIWYKDTQNRILRCNRAAATAIGMSVAELEGRSVSDLYPDEAKKYYADDLEVIRTGRPKFGIIEQLPVASGEKRWVQTDKLPHFDESGKVVGVVVFRVDITERKRMEDVLRESERAQREFVANVSHEFRTPVAAIRGFAETLRRGGLRDAKNRLRFVKIIERHAQRLGGLIENLLTLSTIESGMIKLEPVEIELKGLVDEYVDSIGSLIRRKELRVRVLVKPSTKIVADEAMVLQVLENLFGNAMKFQRTGGSIELLARPEGALVRVTVRDDGPGISSKDLPRVFDRFYKGAGRSAFGSTGLGLHIVKKIVEAHGGRVWAESRLGEGSSFHFTLPRAS